MHKSRTFSPLLVSKRLLIYCLGMFSIAVGVAFSVRSDLGVSPVNSIPYVLSERFTGISMGTFTTAIFFCYILVQALILRRDFSPARLLQIICSFLFGWFVDFANFLLGLLVLPNQNYALRLLYLVTGMAFIGLGVFLYITPNYPVMPSEGIMQVISEKFRKPFPSVKIIFDCTVSLTALVLSLIFFHSLHGVREGTLLAAYGCGKFLGLFKNRFQPALDRFLEME